MIEFYDAETEEELAEAIQRRINDGSIWKFEGSAGRTAMNLIEAGLCMLGRNAAFDYWGNTIPSRDDVEPGTMGSYDYVAAHFGSEHADHIAAI